MPPFVTDANTRAQVSLKMEALMKNVANETVDADRVAKQGDEHDQDAQAAAIRQEAARQS